MAGLKEFDMDVQHEDSKAAAELTLTDRRQPQSGRESIDNQMEAL